MSGSDVLSIVYEIMKLAVPVAFAFWVAEYALQTLARAATGQLLHI